MQVWWSGTSPKAPSPSFSTSVYCCKATWPLRSRYESAMIFKLYVKLFRCHRFYSGAERMGPWMGGASANFTLLRTPNPTV